MAYLTIGSRMINAEDIQSAQLMFTGSSVLELRMVDNSHIFVNCSSNVEALKCLERITMAKNGIVAARSSIFATTKIETAHERQAREMSEAIEKGIASVIRALTR